MTVATSITVRVPLAIRCRPGRKTIVTPMATGPAGATTRADPALVKAQARAFRYQKLMDEGHYAQINKVPEVVRVERHYLGSLSTPPSESALPLRCVLAPRPQTQPPHRPLLRAMLGQEVDQHRPIPLPERGAQH